MKYETFCKLSDESLCALLEDYFHNLNECIVSGVHPGLVFNKDGSKSYVLIQELQELKDYLSRAHGDITGLIHWMRSVQKAFNEIEDKQKIKNFHFDWAGKPPSIIDGDSMSDFISEEIERKEKLKYFNRVMHRVADLKSKIEKDVERFKMRIGDSAVVPGRDDEERKSTSLIHVKHERLWINCCYDGCHGGIVIEPEDNIMEYITTYKRYHLCSRCNNLTELTADDFVV